MNKKQPKLKFEEDKERTATRSPPKKEKMEQTQPRKKLKLDADKAAEKAQHLRLGKAEITPDEASRMTKAQKREMYASAIARSAAHREVDQYEDDNVGTQALNEGLKTEESAADFSKSRYSRKLKKKAKLQAKKKLRATKSSAHEPDKVQNAGEAIVTAARVVPTGFPGGGRNRTFAKATMLLPGRAAPQHRPLAGKRSHPAVHLPLSPV